MPFLRSLQNMKNEWKPVNFDTFAYKESGTFLLKGIDEVQALLDDHIVKTQAIRSSPFSKPFEKECKEWEAKLLYVQDALDQGRARGYESHILPVAADLRFTMVCMSVI